MIEKPRNNKTPKNYEIFLLNNVGLIHYNCLHIKFGELYDGSNKEGWMLLEYDSMHPFKRPLKMTKKEMHDNICHYMTKTFEGCESEEEIHIYCMPCPQQTNSYDCMLYSIYYMEAFFFALKKMILSF